MTWLRSSDTETSDPRYLAIAANRDELNRVLGMAWRLREFCARHRTDGRLPAMIVHDVLTPKWLRAFTSGDRPLLHVRTDGTVPPCCDYGQDWPPDRPYLWHGYLRDNMSAAEADVATAKRAELRDAELKHEVRTRDRDRCRYCGRPVVWADRRSAGGGVFDHVDPARADGAANMVVACRQCNSIKGKRRPEVAGMKLLPTNDGSTDRSQVRPLTDPYGTGRATELGHRQNPYLRDWRDPADHAGLPDSPGGARFGRDAIEGSVPAGPSDMDIPDWPPPDPPDWPEDIPEPPRGWDFS